MSANTDRRRTISMRVRKERPKEHRIAFNVLALVMLILISALDYFTGMEMSFSIFYLLPVAMSAWHTNRISGLVASGASALCWIWMDLASGRFYSSPWIGVWNMLVRFAFYVIVVELVMIVRRDLEEERTLSRTDDLTGALNYRFFKETMRKILKRRDDLLDDILEDYPAWTDFVLAYIDLDNFKYVNDKFGHEAGDRVLQSVAGIIRNHIRSTDIFARLGGDEFALVLPQGMEVAAGVVLERICAELQSYARDTGYPISLSIGVVEANVGVLPLEELVHQADDLMYRAKHQGKNCIVTAKAVLPEG